MANEFKVKKGLIVDGSNTVLDIQGTQGQLFSVTDSLTGDLFSVSDVSGIPILNVNSSGTIEIDGSTTLTGTLSSKEISIKQQDDSGFDAGLTIERSANTQKVHIGMDGGAVNFNSPDGLSYKFRNAGNEKVIISGAGNVSMATGNSTGKFAVMSTAVHGSYDFYNNGTSYFNGAVVIDHNLDMTSNGVIKMGGTEVISAARHISATTGSFTGQVDAKTLTIDGSSLGSYHDFQSKPIDSDSGLFTVGGHGEAGGYSRAVSIFTSHDGVWNSWVGTNLRWDGTNFKRASDAGNNNWGNIAGIRFLGNSSTSGAAMQFIIDPPDQSSNPSGEQTIGTSLPSSMTALSINNDLSATFAGDLTVGSNAITAKRVNINSYTSGAGLVMDYGNSAGTIESISLKSNGVTAPIKLVMRQSPNQSDLVLAGSSGSGLTLDSSSNATFAGNINVDTNGSVMGDESTSSGTTVLTLSTYEPFLVFKKGRDAASGYDYFKIKCENPDMAVDFTTAYNGGSDNRTARITSNGRWVIGGHAEVNASQLSVQGTFGTTGAATFGGEISQIYNPGNAGAFQYLKNANSGSSAYVSKKWQNNDASFGEIWRNSTTRNAGTGNTVSSFNMYNSADINFWSGGTHTLKLSGNDATFTGTVSATRFQGTAYPYNTTVGHTANATTTYIEAGSSSKTSIELSGGDVNSNIKFITPNASNVETLALTIDTSQHATFTADVISNANFETSGTGYLYLGGHVRLNNPGSGAFKLGQYNGSSWTDTLNITNAGNATFAGDVTVDSSSTAGSTVLDVQGTAGQLFSVTNSLTGDLFSVSDVSGIPILNVNSSGLVEVDNNLKVSGPQAEIHNLGNDTIAKLVLSGHNNTGTPGVKTNGTIEHRGADLKTVITNNGSDVITLGTGTQTTFAGNVGVGIFPTSNLSVQGTTNNGINVIGVGTTANRCYVGLTSSNHGQLFCTGSSGQSPSLISSAGAYSYISGGRFGILTTNPSAPLDVAGGGSANQIGAAIFRENSTTAYLTTSFNSRPTHTLYGINTTNTYVGTRLSHAGNTEFFQGIVKGAANGEIKYVFQGYNGTAYQEFGYIDCYTTGAGSLVMSGDIVAYSDKKLKKNIKTLDGSKVYKMRGVGFDRIDTGKKSSGVIAQEIQKVAPELVNESKEGTLGVAYGNLTGYLIEAIKDLKAEIEELKKQIK